MIPRMERQDKRLVDQLRPISFETGIAPNATASVLVTFGRTKVICAVTIEEDVPRWMKVQRVEGGWLTAEYSMLPYSTLDRKRRDITAGKLDGRSSEIQRLIGRSLRAAVDLGKDNIRVNTIIPGTIVTPMTKIICDYPKVLKSCEEKTCLGHIGEPNDIAYGVLYLASDEAKYVTGSDLTIDGGERFKDALEHAGPLPGPA